MTVPLVGIDLVHIPRLAAMLASAGAQAFLDEGWRASEQADCGGRASALAATWAAKEATMKVLGVGMTEVALTDIEVVRESGRPPRLRLHGSAAARAAQLGNPALALSMSHEADTAVATVFGVAAVGAAGAVTP